MIFLWDVLKLITTRRTLVFLFFVAPLPPASCAAGKNTATFPRAYQIAKVPIAACSQIFFRVEEEKPKTCPWLGIRQGTYKFNFVKMKNAAICLSLVGAAVAFAPVPTKVRALELHEERTFGLWDVGGVFSARFELLRWNHFYSHLNDGCSFVHVVCSL